MLRFAYDGDQVAFVFDNFNTIIDRVLKGPHADEVLGELDAGYKWNVARKISEPFHIRRVEQRRSR